MEKKVTLFRVEFLTNTLLFSVVFAFYYVFVYHTIPKMVTTELVLTIQACCTFSIAIGILLFSHIKHTFSKKYLLFSTIFTIISLITAFFVQITIVSVFCIVLIGFCFGITILLAYMHFASTTKAQTRGRTGGIIWLIALPLYFVASNIIASNLNLEMNILLCIILSSFALLASFFIKDKNPRTLDLKESSYYPEKRTIIFYTIPWIIYAIINATLAVNITNGTIQWISPSFYTYLIIAQTIAALIGAVGGGFLADHYGRKTVLLLGISLYGISMAFRGFVNIDGAFAFAYIGEGLSSGIFLTMYSFVVWSDLGNKINYAKIFAIGTITFYLSVTIGRLGIFSDISLIPSALISCILIFLSNVPLAFVPELLPSDSQEKNKLKKYMKAVKKIADHQS